MATVSTTKTRGRFVAARSGQQRPFSMLLRRSTPLRKVKQPSINESRRSISSGEKPAMVQERISEISSGAQMAEDRRMGYLRLGSYVFTGVGLTYLVLFMDFRDANGNEYEHCFSPIRRAFYGVLDNVTGVDKDT